MKSQGQPKQKPRGRIQTIKNTAHYKPVALTGEQRSGSAGTGVGAKPRLSGLSESREELKTNMMMTSIDLRGLEMERLFEDLESLRTR